LQRKLKSFDFRMDESAKINHNAKEIDHEEETERLRKIAIETQRSVQMADLAEKADAIINRNRKVIHQTPCLYHRCLVIHRKYRHLFESNRSDSYPIEQFNSKVSHKKSSVKLKLKKKGSV
jgi:hypothetical protein